MTARNRSLQFVVSLLCIVLIASLCAGRAAAAPAFVVNSTGDGGDVNPGDGVCDDGTGKCTLRAAIQEANARAGADAIQFGIGSGPQTIAPGSALPTITGPVTIDGTTQPGYAGSPIIELNGTGAGAGTHGLRITAGNSLVRGLVINRFGSNGILLETNGENRVEGCFIGTDMAGAVALGNGFSATDVTEQNGVAIVNAPNNTIGGTAAGARNLISGNKKDGVYISGSTATGNVVQGNYIGTNLAGTGALGNLRTGVTASNITTVGGVDPGAGNLISGNLVGVQIFGTGNVVQGNFIGTNATGTATLGNSQRGIELYGPSNTIGGVTAGARNLISGNFDGIAIISATGNRIQGNFIGTNATGTAALGNVRDGVLVVTGASNNTVGGTDAGAGNLISGNGRHGIDFQSNSSSVTGNLVQGNLIGTDVTGTAALGNVSNGVTIETVSTNNTIGGAAAGARNVISGNKSYGIRILSGASGNQVLGNFIGTDVTGTAALGNTVDGVAVQSANNTIGGVVAGAGNLISGNRSDGVTIGPSASGNRVLGNSIGTNLAGIAALGNLGSGVVIFSSATNNAVGGTESGSGNLISGNRANGVQITSSSAGNLVQGNRIGTNATGTAGLGNTLNGVLITNSASGNTLGGTASGAGNTIAYNGGAGVSVPAGTGNAILSNAIYFNGGLGIDLDGAGVTANDAGDGDTGPNNLQNFPALTLAVAGGNTVSGTLNSSANTTFRVEFFSNAAADPTGYGEGQTFLGATTVTTDGSGNGSFTASVPVSAGQFISATATDPNNNTSEFAGSIAAVTNRPPVAANDAAATNEDAAVNVAVQSNDSDPDGDGLTGTAVTQGANGSVTINGDGTVKYTPNADFNGSDSFTYTISDGHGGSSTATATVSVTVTPVNDAPTLGAIPDPAAIPEDAGAQTINLSGIGSGAANEAQTLSVTATSSNTALIPDPTVTHTSPGATGSLNYTPVANASGTATITVTVQDDGGTANGGVDTVTRTFAVTVTPVNDAPVASAGGPYGVDEGSSVIVTATGSDIDGDALTFAWDLDNNGSFETPGQSVSFTGLDGPGSYTITVKATDSGGAWATAQATVQVRNIAPTAGAISAPVDPVPVGTAVNASATFTDPGAPDTHTAVWAWGDGATSTGAVNETNGSGSVSGSHTYAAAGVYRVTLAVTDDDGGSDESVFQFVVVYDPTAGYVTGGGWIDSPAGVYAPNPSLTGRANFGFVAKYQKGADVPTGQTQFNFKVASLDFHSTAYEWLVVSGAHAKYKGSGVINNSGDYGFMLTATDGQISGGGGVDRFRIKIWNKGTGGVIYDNQMGADDDADATDAIEGGSVVIHSGGAAKPVALAKVAEGEDAPAVPEAFGLDPNYPNPFNPVTTIRYALLEGADVSLTVYNLLGQQVRVLVNVRQMPGVYSVSWDSRDAYGRTVASGLYFYRLEAGPHVAVRKMLLMK